MKSEKQDYWLKPAAAILGLFIHPAVIMCGWNWLSYNLSSGSVQLGYWQSFVIVWMAGILFKGGAK